MQAAFFDADLDGDLDVYLLNHPAEPPKIDNAISYRKEILNGTRRTDIFLRNEDGFYVDRTTEAGLFNYGYRHGIAISDIDKNGYPDIYVSSDFDDPDHLFMNRGDGTFKDRIDRMQHISTFSMGNDIADINNDGWADIMVVDMTPDDHVRSKVNMASMDATKFFNLVKYGFHHQYMVNTLQLNNGNGTFSEIAQLAGVSKTDWSWSTLFADLDNDGLKDIFITNGVKRDVLNNDVRINATKLIEEKKGQVGLMDIIGLMPTSKLKNAVFRNTGNLMFEDVTESWSADLAVNSNGAVCVDLDNDGDLDLVTNNVDEAVVVYRNEAAGSEVNYLDIQLKGAANNRNGIGTKVTIHVGNESQYQEMFPVRGYLSSSPYRLHFGLGSAQQVERVEVIWPNGKKQLINAPIPIMDGIPLVTLINKGK